MPQLNPADFLPQLFWLAVTFTTLYLILARLSLPQVTKVREQRATRIADDLDSAEKVKRQADDAKVANETALASARAKALAIGASADEATKTRASERLSEVAAKLAGDLDAAEANIAKAKAEALGSLRDVAAEACKDIVAKLSGLALDDAVIRAAVEDKLKTVQGVKH